MRAALFLILFVAGCAPRDGGPDAGVPPERPRESEIVERFLERKERWAVKTGADQDASRVRLDRPVKTTVAELTRLRRPRDITRDRRSAPIETTLYTADIEVVSFKFQKDDQDIHMVIRDPGRNPNVTLVIEFPDPTVVARSSPFRPGIVKARQALYEHYRPSGRFKGGGKRRARVTGVGFFDFLHGQRGMAESGLELHPIVGFEMLD